MDLQKNERIRKLTPRECLRLMAYTDEEIDRLEQARDAKDNRIFSNSAMYKFAGNSVVVDCFRYIFEEILDDMELPQETQTQSMQATLLDFTEGR